MTSDVVITGATGFVGRALMLKIGTEPSWNPKPLKLPGNTFHGCWTKQASQDGNSESEMQWDRALAGANTVIHLAARVHVMNDTALDQLAEFRKVNVLGTKNLALAAVTHGVKRFVYISSVKVNGESTVPRQVFTERDAPHPFDPYAVSKHEAEIALRRIATETGMEVVIIRPPLVYGPGVKANFAALLRAVARGVPLPLGAVHNLRSLVGLDNLVSFIHVCMTHPAAANQTFLVSDGEDLSTAALVRRMAQAMGRPARLWPVPPWLLLAGATVLGKHAAAQRLCGNLQVDIRKARDLLGWTPPVSVDEGLRRTVVGMP